MWAICKTAPNKCWETFRLPSACERSTRPEATSGDTRRLSRFDSGPLHSFRVRRGPVPTDPSHAWRRRDFPLVPVERGGGGFIEKEQRYEDDETAI